MRDYFRTVMGVEGDDDGNIRRAVDDRGKPGQFILTGSAVPADDVTRHTGAGRLTRLRMRPMTLYETGHADGTASLAELLAGTPVPAIPEPGLTVADLSRSIAVGGWPGLLGFEVDRSLRAVRDYLEEIRRVDIGRVDGTWRDPDKVGRLLRSLARNVSSPVAITTLAADAGGADGPLDDQTVREYLDALERKAILDALAKTGFNRTAAAKLLGITFRQLRYRMQRLGIREETKP